MNEEYKPNSDVSKEKREHREAVVTGQVRKKQGGARSKLRSAFAFRDIGEVSSYILEDVTGKAIPAIQNSIVDVLCDGIRMLMGAPSSRKQSDVPGARVSYRQYYRDGQDRPSRPAPRHGYDDVIFDNRGDAEEVLFRMEELLEHYQTVSVADMLDLCGITSAYTDNKYGWNDLRDARVMRVSEGYIIDLPRPMAL